MKTRRTDNTKTITECGILIALSTVLSMIKLIPMPLGGAVTLVSMLPVCAVSVRHGLRWGLLSSFSYSLLQLVLGIVMSGLLGWGLTPVMLFGCIAFDYIFAFTVLGLAGMFRKKGEWGIYAGFSLAFFLRFQSHVLSGILIFRELGQWTLFGDVFTDEPVLYSLCYNGFFMLPELVITLIALYLLMRIPYVRRKIIGIGR